MQFAFTAAVRDWFGPLADESDLAETVAGPDLVRYEGERTALAVSLDTRRGYQLDVRFTLTGTSPRTVSLLDWLGAIGAADRDYCETVQRTSSGLVATSVQALARLAAHYARPLLAGEADAFARVSAGAARG